MGPNWVLVGVSYCPARCRRRRPPPHTHTHTHTSTPHSTFPLAPHPLYEALAPGAPMPLLTPPHRLIATPLALPLPSAVPAPLPFSSRPGAQSRIHVGGKRLRAYPCDLFLEPVFAKKTPAASSCALMWTPRTPQLNVGMAPQGSFRRCEKNARPCAAMRRTHRPTLNLGVRGRLSSFHYDSGAGVFFANTGMPFHLF